MLVQLLFAACFATPIKLIPNQYIVVFKDHVTSQQIDLHHFDLSSAWTDAFEFLHKYSLPEFNAYAARLDKSLVTFLRNHPDVDYVEQDAVITLDTVLFQDTISGDEIDIDLDSLDSVNTFDHKKTALHVKSGDKGDISSQPQAPSWGLPRISSRDPPTTKEYQYPSSQGTGVDVYVIDTGIFVQHPQFEGRARLGKSFTTDGNKDGNGHGTHVAGTIGSKTYGVAKNATLIAVKVLDAQGSGTTSSVIAGIEWAAKQVQAKKSKTRKSVANMSLGGGASVALDRAVKGASNAGLTFGVAAGNSGRDACSLSPARVPEAITVAASDISDNLASFSERGKCVDIIAPGVNILSTWNNGKTNTISGTSMATPHVVGVVALALAEGEFETVKQVHDYIKAVSSKDKISGALRGAPNNFLYNQVLDGSFPDDEPREPTPQPPEDPDDPSEGECPIPQCLFDPACNSAN